MTALTPRPYQEDAITAVLAAHTRGVRRPLIVLATGAGKTIIFAELIRRRGGRALVMAHRDELIGQAVDKLRLVMPNAEIGVVKAERDERDAPIVVASIQTLARPGRLARIARDFSTVVVDEAHHAAAETYRLVLAHLGCFDPDGPLTLGVTATADRGDGVGLGAVFEEIVYELPILDLIEQGYLSDLRAVQVRLRADYGALHVRGGDFVDSESAAAFLDADGPTHVAAAYAEHARDRKGLVFTPTVAVAHAVAEAFGASGVPAAAVDGSTPTDERRRILRDFAAGTTRVVANCAVLTEGFDEPSIGCVVVARPTRSRALFQQMIGRGTRRYPGKDDCLVLDVVGASTRHDLQTTATLFGLPVDALATATVATAAAQRREIEEAAHREGELVARTVDLFRRRPVHWVPAGGERFVLATGRGSLVLRQRENAWDVLHLPEHDPPGILATGLDLGYAQGLAEDRAVALGAGALVAREAAWRLQPPTDKQLWRLRRLGIPRSAATTKGQATDLITAAEAARASLGVAS